MAAYRTVVASVEVRNTSTGEFIPFDAKNKDYIVYLAWVALGNTADVASTSTEIPV